MRIPTVLTSLIDEGIVERVVRPLMSGKEAQVYLVLSGGRECVAKIYKEAENRTFKHRADYTEGRKVRNSRDQRAIQKRSQHGRDQDEAAWRSTEVDMIYRLHAAGVRVPAPYHFIDGVLIMELVTDANGEPAPRLGEVDFAPEEAKVIYERLIQDVVRMLCAGVVHGDLSDFNVLYGADGPVIIDFPQSVDPSKNQNARKLLLRDVENLHRFYTRCVPEGRRAPFAEEMWALFESNQLVPETRLRGVYRPSQKRANVTEMLDFIGEVNEDERRRRRSQGRDASAIPAPPAPRRVEVQVQQRPAVGPRPVAARQPEGGVHNRQQPAAQGVAARPAQGAARPVQGAARPAQARPAQGAARPAQNAGAAWQEPARSRGVVEPRQDAQGAGAARPERPRGPAPHPAAQHAEAARPVQGAAAGWRERSRPRVVEARPAGQGAGAERPERSRPRVVEARPAAQGGGADRQQPERSRRAEPQPAAQDAGGGGQAPARRRRRRRRPSAAAGAPSS
jgi:RIO kinase 1